MQFFCSTRAQRCLEDALAFFRLLFHFIGQSTRTVLGERPPTQALHLRGLYKTRVRSRDPRYILAFIPVLQELLFGGGGG